MKPALRDYLTILMALIAIFLCGYGVGFLLGEKKGRNQSTPLTLIENSGEEASNWEENTLQRISESLELTDEQKIKVRSEVKETSKRIQKSRNHAFEDYYRHLLDLHHRLLPNLDKDQQKKIEKDQKSLQRAIDSQFQSTQ